MMRTSGILAALTAFLLLLSATALEMAGFDIVHRAWTLKTSILGPEEIGIWEDHPVLGWTHKASVVGRHRKLPDFSVLYTIDELRHRVTESAYGKPGILVLGGSYTFGDGVEDHQNYPALLQREYPNHKVINAGVSAWGTGQAYLKLKEQLSSDEDIVVVIYGFIGHHIHRNYLRKGWLETLQGEEQRKSPFFELVDGRLVYGGVAEVEDGLPVSEQFEQKEREITIALLKEMKALCGRHNVPFFIAYLPNPMRTDFDVLLESEFSPTTLVNIHKTVDYSTIRFAHDGHPTPQGHKLIAQQINMRFLAGVLSGL